jgi:inhibitor of KinA
VALYPRVLMAGDGALTIEFGSTIDPEINDRVMACSQAVDRLSLSGLLDIVPTYRSVTVYLDPLKIDIVSLAERIQALAVSLAPHTRQSGPGKRAGLGQLGAGGCKDDRGGRVRLIEIPVLYGEEYGLDLPAVAAFAKRSIEDVIALHMSVEYRVYMLGFSPGFPYMGKIPDEIALPRLAAPRAKVPAGSVAIAGSQTSIYPIESPGGWRLIGRTPLRLYDPNRARPFLLEPEDRVRFVPITRRRYDDLHRRQK